MLLATLAAALIAAALLYQTLYRMLAATDPLDIFESDYDGFEP